MTNITTLFSPELNLGGGVGGLVNVGNRHHSGFPFPWRMECLPLDAAETGNSRLSFSWWIAWLRAAVWANDKVPVLLTRCQSWFPVWKHSGKMCFKVFKTTTTTKSQNYITATLINNAVAYTGSGFLFLLRWQVTSALFSFFFQSVWNKNIFLQKFDSWWH